MPSGAGTVTPVATAIASKSACASSYSCRPWSYREGTGRDTLRAGQMAQWTDLRQGEPHMEASENESVWPEDASGRSDTKAELISPKPHLGQLRESPLTFSRVVRENRFAWSAVSLALMLFVVAVITLLRGALHRCSYVGTYSDAEMFRKMCNRPTTGNVVSFLTGSGRESVRPEIPPEVGLGEKFALDGTAQTFPGTTVICQLQNAPRRTAEDFVDALVSIQQKFKSQPFSESFTYTPRESFHMTVAGLMLEKNRGHGTWPSKVSRTLPLKNATEMLRTDFARLKGPTAIRIKPVALVAGTTLSVEPADHREGRRLRATRASILSNLDFPDHGESPYAFHITLGYRIRWLDAETARQVDAYARELFEGLVARFPVVELGAPEFCSFESMNLFTTLERMRAS